MISVPTGGEELPGKFSLVYRRYVLATLTLVYTLNYLDRGLIILLLQPIKEDLRLSDTQMGFVTGIAFALFYATLGLPIARWADRGNRVTIASVAIGVWGGTVMACLLVSNFVQLVFARVAAAVGESGCMPPTYSLIGDYFPAAAERTRAMTVYWLASPAALLISLVAGGWLNEQYGWRATFFVMGLPALMVAVLVKLTIIEPRFCGRALDVNGPPAPRAAAVLRTLWKQSSTRNLTLAIVLFFTMGLGLTPWYAAFMMRSHGMDTAVLGGWLGLIFGIGGAAGTFLGGYLGAGWLARDERSQMRLCAMMTAFLVPCVGLFVLMPDGRLALIALIPLVVAIHVYLGPTFAVLQRLVADEMRATTLAIVMLLANLIGMGLGPQMVGFLSDMLSPTFGVNSLRYAMLVVSLIGLLAAYHFWQASNAISQDLLMVEEGRRLSATGQRSG